VKYVFFFLKKNGGKQVPVQLSGMDIPLMDGPVKRSP